MSRENALGDGEVEDRSSRRANPVDVHVGARVRLRRMLLGMSQEKLGEQLGLTFQQIQKYEKGINRIGASRLFDLSQVLSVPVQFFYEELPVSGAGGPQVSASARRRAMRSNSLAAARALSLTRPLPASPTRACAVQSSISCGPLPAKQPRPPTRTPTVTFRPCVPTRRTCRRSRVAGLTPGRS